MRLTLRTLLAWRDGLLKGAERDELAAKVAASPVAPRLLAGIAELASRVDLPAPNSDDGRTADDANSVAEFLDNVLSPEQLEDFERVCLESEIHLAEVAECHAILAEVIRDARVGAPLDASASARLLNLVLQDGAIDRDKSQREGSAEIVAPFREAARAATRAGKANLKERPNASLGAWLSAVAAIALLIILGGLLLRSIWLPVGRSRQVAVADPRSELREPPARIPVSPPPGPSVAEPAPEVPPKAPAVVPADNTVESESAATATTASIPPSEEPSLPLARPPEPAVIPMPVIEADEEESPAAEPESEPEAPVAAPPAIARVVSGGPLLRRVTAGAEPVWRAILVDDALGEVDDVIVPVHCYPQVARGDVSIRLLPGARAAVSSDHDGTLRLVVVFGRAVVWSEVANARVGITAGGLSGVFALGPRQPVGIEVELARERGTDPAVVPPGMEAVIIAPGGGWWRQTEADGGIPGAPLAGLAMDQPLVPGHHLEWSSSAPGAASIMPLPQEPKWMQLTGPTNRVEHDAAAAITSALEAEGEPLKSLRAMADSRRVEERAAAAATLALLGDYDPLVQALCDDSDDPPGTMLREGQWRALEAMTVPLALARGKNAAGSLRQSFARQGLAGREAELYLLARGLSAKELAAGGAAGLVAGLEDSALVVRRYALANLLSLLPDPAEATRDYRPDRLPRDNEKGLAWWRARLSAGELGGEANP